MEQWYENALKPSKLYVQNENLVQRYYETKLKKFAFLAIVEEFRGSRGKHEMRRNAIENIFYIMSRGNNKELKRGMFIWKNLLRHDTTKSKRLQHILRKCDRAIKLDMLLTWQRRSRELDE
jgi:hypothetical protein